MTSSSLRLRDSDREQLRAGAAALGVDVDAAAETKLAAYSDLLELWSRRINLLSCRTAAELVGRHFLDSLAVEPLLPDEGPVVDLGSGAGFPGVPLAIVHPERKIALVEIRRRRANFLREVRRTLSLDNLEVLEQRAEAPPSSYQGQASSVVSRAVWSDEAIFKVAGAWLPAEGQLFWTRTDPLSAETDCGDFVRWRTIRYRIESSHPKTIEVFTRR